MVHSWESIVKFESDDGGVYYTPLALDKEVETLVSARVQSYKNLQDLENGSLGTETIVKKVKSSLSVVRPKSC